MTLETVREQYNLPRKLVVTAHRGFSGKYPENTIEAFDKALELGVEFDVRCSKDGVPVVMHDPTVDRVSNGRGEVRSLLFSELRELNVSFWDGPHDTGRRLPEPTRTQSQIPTLEEVLVFLKGNVLLNIQVYEPSIAGLKTLSDLYRKYHLYNEAFLMVESFAVAEQIRDVDPAIELCVGEARSNLERHKQFGVNFIQPTKDLITPEFMKEARRLKLCGNMFYANTAADCHRYLEMGIKGILSDRPDLMMEAAREK